MKALRWVPYEFKDETERDRRDPARAMDAVNRIDWHLENGIPSLRFIGWVIIFLLALILWRVW